MIIKLNICDPLVVTRCLTWQIPINQYYKKILCKLIEFLKV